MKKTASLSAVFAGYVAVMFAIASIPGEALSVMAQTQIQQPAD